MPTLSSFRSRFASRSQRNLFPTTTAAQLQFLETIVGAELNNFLGSSRRRQPFGRVISNRLISQSRSIQGRNIRNLSSSLFNLFGANDVLGGLGGGGFLPSLLGSTLNQAINSSLQRNLLGNSNTGLNIRSTIINKTQNQIASEIIRQLRRGGRNL